MSSERKHHGLATGRGCAHLGQGRFGRMFDLRPLYSSDAALTALGRAGGLMDTVGATPDVDIPAGYAFFAQFVDHDVTLDVTSQLDTDQVQDVESFPNLRSASLDLDCIYGFGPEGSPHLYVGGSHGELRTGTAANPDDLARTEDGVALIGDPRNDENLFVSQLQYLFLRLHNRLLARHGDFEIAQREARYHYQYVVLHDLLRRICDPGIYRFARERLYRREAPLVYGPDAHGELRMPVEFSVAAYRFGHSMIRSTYPVNAANPALELFSEARQTTGFKPVPPDLVIDWRYLLDLPGDLWAKSKKIDQRLARELNDLAFIDPADEPDPRKRSLAFRNLVRGRSLGLPSGEDVAAALHRAGYPLPPRTDLKLDEMEGWSAVDREVQDELQGATPLFFHVLRESTFGDTLGKVGSAILMEVFSSMLQGCATSYLQAERWSPDAEIVAGDHELTLADLARYALH